MGHFHEQLTEECHCDDPVFYNDWLVEVNAVLDECSVEVYEYLLSRMNLLLSVMMSKMSWLEDFLQNSGDQSNQNEPPC